MSEISRVALFGKLNPMAYKAIESATVFCKMRGNPYVELVHWFAQLLQTQGTDLEAIVRHYQLDPSAIAREVTTALDRLPRGSTAISDFNEHIELSIQQGWLYGTLMFGQAQVRTGYLLLGMLNSKVLTNALQSMTRQFDRVKADDLAQNFQKICGATQEATLGAQDGSGLAAGTGGDPGGENGAMAPAAMGKQEALRRSSASTSPSALARARWIRSPAAMKRSARSSTS